MIKIRYADLPEGLHAQVRARGRRTVIYLIPGLSPAQRRHALRRLIRTSRLGHGPRLRARGVALAVARDVVGSTLRNGLAAVRCHPAGSLLLAVFLTSAVVCYALFVSVSIRLGPQHAGPPVAQGAPPLVPGTAGSSGRPRASAGSGPAGSVPAGGGADASPAPSGAGPSQLAASPTPLPSSSSSASPGPSPSAGPTTASPAPDPTPTPLLTNNPGGLCVNVGPLGVCVSV
ncbi:MAG TPA: hypothetical protein VMV92_26395 [Streptosporangiaceae bacterium]|nr:hypothetical protein [Streptosporangiaceae bacterium]